MFKSRIVNGLIESMSNAEGPIRELQEVGRMLTYCQQRCEPDERECQLLDREQWIRVLITPGERCDRRLV